MPRTGVIPFRKTGSNRWSPASALAGRWWVIPRVRSLSSDPRNDSGLRTLDGAPSRHNTPALVMLDLDSYVSGFVDGEGCFCVSFQPSVRHVLGWEARPSFSVSQNADRAQLLYMLQQRWGCGSIRPDRSDSTVKFEVRNLKELVETVIPHFERCPLVSAKQTDFVLFSEICQRMSRGEHRTHVGFRMIVEAAMRMNSSGKRKYSSGEILKSLATR